MADGNGRDGNGRFSIGNGGGPGRPRKREILGDATLRELAVEPTGPELYLTAMAVRDRDEWLARIDGEFAGEVARRIRRLVAVSELARNELVRRLRDLPV